MIVLDTHVLIWLIQDDARLGDEGRRLITDAALGNQVLVSAITAWEIALLARRGKICLPIAVARWMRDVLDGTGLRLAPLEPEIAVSSVTLDWHHRDPADRIIVATAQYWSAALMTVDREIHAFARQGQVDVLDASR